MRRGDKRQPYTTWFSNVHSQGDLQQRSSAVNLLETDGLIKMIA
jgi:hypothetical protein